MEVVGKAGMPSPRAQVFDGSDEIEVEAQPFDMRALRQFRRLNPHQAACLSLLVNTTVGRGWRSPDVNKVLQPLVSARTVPEFFRDVWKDCEEVGNGYFEVVRTGGPDSPIGGLHYVDAVNVYRERDNRWPHLSGFQVMRGRAMGTTFGKFRIPRLPFGNPSGVGRAAPFGYLREYADRNALTEEDRRGLTEIIDFRGPRADESSYGEPRYMGAVPMLELAMASLQCEFDFLYNRGQPDYIYALLGKVTDDETWNEFVAAVEGGGPGQTHTSAAVNIPDADVTLQVEKVGADETTGDRSRESMQQASRAIISAHGVPPRLAQIELEGAQSTGSNAELMEMYAFQTARVEPWQIDIEERMAATLGNPRCNGGLALRRKHLVDEHRGDPEYDVKITGKMRAGGLRTLTDDLDLMTLQNASRMRDPVAGSNRNPADGTNERGEDRAREANRGSGARLRRA